MHKTDHSIELGSYWQRFDFLYVQIKGKKEKQGKGFASSYYLNKIRELQIHVRVEKSSVHHEHVGTIRLIRYLQLQVQFGFSGHGLMKIGRGDFLILYVQLPCRSSYALKNGGYSCYF